MREYHVGIHASEVCEELTHADAPKHTRVTVACSCKPTGPKICTKQPGEDNSYSKSQSCFNGMTWTYIQHTSYFSSCEGFYRQSCFKFSSTASTLVLRSQHSSTSRWQHRLKSEQTCTFRLFQSRRFHVQYYPAATHRTQRRNFILTLQACSWPLQSKQRSL